MSGKVRQTHLKLFDFEILLFYPNPPIGGKEEFQSCYCWSGSPFRAAEVEQADLEGWKNSFENNLSNLF